MPSLEQQDQGEADVGTESKADAAAASDSKHAQEAEAGAAAGAGSKASALPPMSVVGGNLTREPACFSPDSNLLFACCGRSIKVFSVRTGESVTSLQGHSALVTRVLAVPPQQGNSGKGRKNQLLLSSSADGSIKMWDFMQGACVSTYHVGFGPIWDIKLLPQRSPAAPSADRNSNSNSNSSKRSRSQNNNSNEDGEDSLQAVLCCQSADLRKHYILLVDLKNKTNKVLYQVRAFSSLAVSPHADFVASTGGHSLFVFSLEKKILIEHVNQTALHTVTFHPRDSYLATGDENGVIKLWYRFFHVSQTEEGNYNAKRAAPAAKPELEAKPDKQQQQEQQQPQQKQHANPQPTIRPRSKPITSNLVWHAHAVASLVFSDEGSYLLSGGEEAVLVTWQLQTGLKQFLPRIGVQILHITISPCGKLYALSCADNAIRFISALSNQIELVITGLHTSHSLDIVYNPSVRFDRHVDFSLHQIDALEIEPRNGTLAISSLPGCVQFYDTVADRSVREMWMMQRNVVSRIDDERLPSTHVEWIRFAIARPQNKKHHFWMATVERRPETNEVKHEVIALKFWHFDTQSKQFVLNTCVNSPHEKRISAIQFDPTGQMLVTASEDSSFKIWSVQEKEKAPARPNEPRHKARQSGDMLVWTCQSVGSYHRKRVTDAAFSADGSTLAIAYGQTITLWNVTSSISLVHTLNHPPASEPINGLAFLPGSSFLVAYTHHTLYVWDLLTLSVWWSAHISLTSLATHSTKPIFAALAEVKVRTAKKSNSSFLLVFEANTPTPLKMFQVKNPFVSNQRKTFLKFLPGTDSLIYVSKYMELVRLDDIFATGAALPQKKQAIELTQSESALNTLFAKKKGQQRGKWNNKDDNPSFSRPDMSHLIGGPSNILPSVGKLYESYIDLYAKRANNEEATSSTTTTTTTTTTVTTSTTTIAEAPSGSSSQESSRAKGPKTYHWKISQNVPQNKDWKFDPLSKLMDVFGEQKNSQPHAIINGIASPMKKKVGKSPSASPLPPIAIPSKLPPRLQGQHHKSPKLVGVGVKSPKQSPLIASTAKSPLLRSSTFALTSPFTKALNSSNESSNPNGSGNGNGSNNNQNGISANAAGTTTSKKNTISQTPPPPTRESKKEKKKRGAQTDTVVRSKKKTKQKDTAERTATAPVLFGPVKL